MTTALPGNLAGVPPAGSAPSSQYADSTASGPSPGAPEGGFQGMLEQRMQAPASPGAGPETMPGPVASISGELAVLMQGIDPNAIAADPLTGFINPQWLQGTPPADAGVAEDGDTLQLSLARDLAREWRSFAADSETDHQRGSGRGGEEHSRLQAAMDADFGKRLPQLSAEATGAMRAAAGDVAVLERVRGDMPLVVASGDPAGSSHGIAASAGSAAVSAAGEARPTVTQVATPFGRPEWASAMNERVSWLVGQRVQSADIQINPPQLGPVEVRISIHNDQASVLFSSSHAVVRETLQAALPRLAELLSHSGITLGEASVGADSFAGQQHASQDSRGRGSDGGGAHPMSASMGRAVDADASAMQAIVPLRGPVGVDMFV